MNQKLWLSDKKFNYTFRYKICDRDNIVRTDKGYSGWLE